MSTTHDTTDVFADGMACAMRRGVPKATTRPKVVNQYLRARAMADLMITESRYRSPAWLLNLAVQMAAHDWALVAQQADLDHPPSDETVALCIVLLTEHAQNGADQ